MAGFALGLDFGTESARALLVAMRTGKEIAGAAFAYPHGVMERRLQVRGGGPLPPEWALQHPQDYLDALGALVPAVLKDAGVRPDDVVGVGLDFTASTVLPVLADGTPLCFKRAFRAEPHAYVKLWKHHAAQPEADRFNQVARERGEEFLRYYGGAVSSEWLLPKALQIAREAPEVYRAADRIIEAGDWLVWRMVGQERRSACQAGYKAMWVHGLGYPTREYLRAVDRRVERVAESKLASEVFAPGTSAGGLSGEGARLCGLPEGTPVSIASIDAHVGVPACGVTEPGTMVIIMGTSGCHMALSRKPVLFEGFAGLVKDGILPGYYGYESGQSSMGDAYAWFVDNAMPERTARKARAQGDGPHQYLERALARTKPGESGLVALDWLGGNRSVLMDARLSGALVGLTMATTDTDMYRALVEATAFGTRTIIDSYQRAGVPIREIRACGGLPRNRALMRIFADVTGRSISVAASDAPCALGAAMFGALAAGPQRGGFKTLSQAAAKMARLQRVRHEPKPENHRMYNRLYKIYGELHDHFGRGVDLMHRLRRIRDDARGVPAGSRRPRQGTPSGKSAK